MDLRLFSRVIWRFKVVVAAGFVLAIALAVLASAQVRFTNGLSLKYRTPTFYKADATLFVTQPGFPWGSAVQQYLKGKSTTAPVPLGDQTRLTNLAQLYAEYANSDIVRGKLARKGLLNGLVSAQPIITNANVGAPTLPLIDLGATASSAQGAMNLAQAAVEALDSYVKGEQIAAGIAASDRVQIQEIQRPTQAIVAQKPKKTVPILVFVTVMLAILGLAFVLENLRKRPAPASEIENDPPGTANELPTVAGERPAAATELRQAPR